jgi:hypothetical protein
MNKRQQMRCTRRAAGLLLQVRCAVYNGTLGSGFGQPLEAIVDLPSEKWRWQPDPQNLDSPCSTAPMPIEQGRALFGRYSHR